MAENPSSPDPDDNEPQDPLSRMFGQFFGGQNAQGMPDSAAMQAMFGQLQSFFGAMASGGDGPVNWTLAKDSARKAITDSAAVDSSQTRDVAEAARLAELWLDAATEFTTSSTEARALTRTEWVEATLPQWQALTEPVAQSAADAVSGSLETQLPAEATAMLGPAGGMLKSLGGALFGAQLGQAVGTLSSEVLGGTDTGLPLAGRRFALVPQNVAAFSEGLELPRQEVLLYLALREAAHQRLFHSAPWLEAHVLELVRDFAAGISIDTSAIQERIQGIDPSDPAAIQEVLSGGMLEPATTPRQQAALARLETILALIEGWVDAVVTSAADHLPSAPALRETLRRRRALGGPGEQAFAGLVGLQLRPRRAREAATLWESISAEQGAEARDALWKEPGLVPTAEDLDDPAGFFTRRALLDATDEDIDAALAAWLDNKPETPAKETAAEDAEDGPADTSGTADWSDEGGAGEDGAAGPSSDEPSSDDTSSDDTSSEHGEDPKDGDSPAGEGKGTGA